MLLWSVKMKMFKRVECCKHCVVGPNRKFGVSAQRTGLSAELD